MPAAFVQEKDINWFAGSGVTESFTFISSIVPGDLIVVAIGWSVTTSSIGAVVSHGVTDTPFTQIGSTVSDGTNGSLSLWYYQNHPGGTPSIKVTWSADPGFGFLLGHEVSGVLTSGALDQGPAIKIQVVPGTGTNAVQSNSVTTAVAGEYAFGASFDDGGANDTWSAGTNIAWVGRGTNGNWYFSENIILGPAGPGLIAEFTFNSTVNNTITAIATFKPIVVEPLDWSHKSYFEDVLNIEYK